MSYITRRQTTTADKRIRVIQPLPVSHIPLRDTQTPTGAKPTYSVYKMNASDPQTDVELRIVEPVIVFVGFANQNAISGNLLHVETVQMPIGIRIGDVNAPQLYLQAGQSIELPTINNTLYISSAPTGIAQYALFYGFPQGYQFRNHPVSPFFAQDGFGKYEDRMLVANGRGQVDAALTNTQVDVRIKDGDGSTLADVVGGGGGLDDGLSNLVIKGLVTAGLGYLFNESNWDRARGTAAKGAYVQLAGSPKTIVRTAFSFSSSGDTNLVGAAGASTKIKVLGLFLFVGAATNVKITNGAGGSNLIGQCNFAANQGFVLPCTNPDLHYIQTSDNTALVCNSSAAVQIGGFVEHINEA